MLKPSFCLHQGFPGGLDVKESACRAGGPGPIPGSGRSSGEGNGYPLQYSCLGNPINRGAWWAIIHGVSKCWTEQLTHAHNWFQSVHAQPLYQLPLYVLRFEEPALKGSWWSWNKALQEQEDLLMWRNIHVLLSHYFSCDSEAVSVGQKAQDKVQIAPTNPPCDKKIKSCGC